MPLPFIFQSSFGKFLRRIKIQTCTSPFFFVLLKIVPLFDNKNNRTFVHNFLTFLHKLKYLDLTSQKYLIFEPKSDDFYKDKQ